MIQAARVGYWVKVDPRTYLAADVEDQAVLDACMHVLAADAKRASDGR